MSNKRRLSLSGPATPARASEASSVHSFTASNNYIESLVNYFKMPRDHTTAKAHWDENMEMHFCMTYVEWRKSGEWNPNISTEANWMKLAAHLNSSWGKQYMWTVYHSKYTRLRRIWRAFAKLKGLRLSAETGIGWDENRRCFIADESQWRNLQMENKDYNQFRYFQCVDKYTILSEVFEGETATGSQATSSFASPSSRVPRQMPATHLGGQSSSHFDDELLTVDPDITCYDTAPNVGRKRGSASTGVTNSGFGSRQSKSSKSFDNPFIECANSLNNLASAKLQIKDRRANDFEKYDVTMATQVIESFEGLSKGRRVTALLQLQDDKWRKTFLMMSRDLQEYWINKLQVPDEKGPDED